MSSFQDRFRDYEYLPGAGIANAAGSFDNLFPTLPLTDRLGLDEETGGRTMMLAKVLFVSVSLIGGIMSMNPVIVVIFIVPTVRLTHNITPITNAAIHTVLHAFDFGMLNLYHKSAAIYVQSTADFWFWSGDISRSTGAAWTLCLHPGPATASGFVQTGLSDMNRKSKDR